MANKLIDEKFIRPGIIRTFQSKKHVKLNKYGTGAYNVHELIYIIKHAKKTKHSIFFIYDNLFEAYSWQSNVAMDDIVNELFEDKSFIRYYLKHSNYYCWKIGTRQKLYDEYHNDPYILKNIRKSLHFHLQIIHHFGWSMLNWYEKKRFIMRSFYGRCFNTMKYYITTYINRTGDVKARELVTALNQINNLSD